ncbi:MAG TPA: hypothetical protein VE526_04890 [Solirubrobacteraceae bacterium]|nr:hypothetical protein [Solirubrobacteraceae bacterium]
MRVADRRRLDRLGHERPAAPAQHGVLEEAPGGAGRVAPRDLGADAGEEPLELRHGMQLDRGRLVRDDAPHQLRPAGGQLERQQRPVGAADEVDRTAAQRLDHRGEVVLVAPAGRRLGPAPALAVPAAIVGVDAEPPRERPDEQTPGGVPGPRAVDEEERLAVATGGAMKRSASSMRRRVAVASMER